MAVTATFKADFGDFYDAVQKAEVSLDGFQKSTARVEQSLNKMADAFSGRQVIQNATLMAKAIEDIGGVSKLTESELAKVGATANEAAAKLKAMGMDVPKGIQEIADATKDMRQETEGGISAFLHGTPIVEGFVAAFSIERILEFTKQLIESASQIEDLSRATGVSIKGLQQMAYVGLDFGVSMEEMSRGVQQLSERLAGGDQSAAAAVQALGLNVKSLQAAGPQEAFLQIAEAVGQIEDPMQKSAMAADLFGGKLGKVLLPALTSLREQMDDASGSMAIMSDETVKAANSFDVGLNRALMTGKAIIAESIEGWVQLGTAIKNAVIDPHTYENAGKSAAEMNRQLIEMATTQTKTVSNTELLQNRLTALRTQALEPLSAAQQAAILELESYGVSQQEIAKLVGASEEAVHRFTQAHKDEAEAAKKSAADTAAAYRKLVEELDKLEHGHTENQLAEINRIGAAQMAASQKRFEAQVAGIDSIEKAEAALKDFQMKQILDTTSYQIVKIWEAVDEQEKAFKGTEEQRAAFNRAVEALAAEQANALLEVDTDAIHKLAAEGQKAITDTASAATTALQQFSVSSRYSLQQGTDMQAAAAAAGGTVAYDDYGNPYIYIPGVNAAPHAGTSGKITTPSLPQWALPGAATFLSGRAAGGPVVGGSPYLVGEAGPEIFVPSGGGGILPNGAGGATIHNTFNLVDTESNLARRVSEIVTRQVLTGVRIP
jgi:DNA-directed RNA polymerase specialized sigma24 family protein